MVCDHSDPPNPDAALACHSWQKVGLSGQRVSGEESASVAEVREARPAEKVKALHSFALPGDPCSSSAPRARSLVSKQTPQQEAFSLASFAGMGGTRSAGPLTYRDQPGIAR